MLSTEDMLFSANAGASLNGYTDGDICSDAAIDPAISDARCNVTTDSWHQLLRLASNAEFEITFWW